MNKLKFDPALKQCLICGSDQLRTFKTRSHDTPNRAPVDIVECQRCFFAWQYPRGRTETQSVEFFEQAYDESKEQSDYFKKDKKRAIAECEFGFVRDLPVEGRAVLDIGAGAGIFAEVVAEAGWSVTAVDPAMPEERFDGNDNVNAIKGTIADIPAGEAFDVVTLWDVIEHTDDPVAMIAAAGGFLRPGGWLVVETGNYKNANRVLASNDHWIFQLDHRWYFTPDAMRCLLKDAGYTELILCDRLLRPGWTGSADYAGPSLSGLIKSVATSPAKTGLHLARFSELKRVKEWEIAGIGIFAMAARRA